MPKMTQREYQEFLAEPGRYARIGTVDDDGFPRVVPIVFLYTNGKINFTLRPNSAPQRNVRRDPRVSIAVDELEEPSRRVIVQAFARIVFESGQEAEWQHLHRQMLSKTQPKEQIDRYLAGMVEARVERPWLEVDLGAPTTRLTTWRNPLPEEDDGRLVPFAKKYIVHGSDPATPVDEGR